jgi:flagellar biosynthetic protein FlhB
VSDDSDEDKTESASAQRLEKAREEGNIPRSKEMVTFAMLAAGFGGAYALSGSIAQQLGTMLRSALTFDRSTGFETSQMLHRAAGASMTGLSAAAPILGMTAFAALAAPMAIGGFLFSTQALAPKFSRLNPVAGVGRLFSTDSLVTLGMAMAKVGIVGAVAVSVIMRRKDSVLQLLSEPLGEALPHAVQLIGMCCLLITGGLFLIAAADVPYQIWHHAKQLRMTKEELKREYRESEGDPHVKGRIRQQQRAMARQRMMGEVPKADVIVTNPTHFAVALRYDENNQGAPRVVAKGTDLVALRIRELAAENHVPVLEAPPLARALYHHTDLNQEIPGALYGAVAEVLAWVYQLRRWNNAGGSAPVTPSALEVPDGMDPNAPAALN